jgi:hypothetical protein
MGKKEKILELIKEFDGLTYAKIIDLYNKRYKPSSITKESGYVFLSRLRESGLVKSEGKDDVKGKLFIYEPTLKALNQKIEPQQNSELIDKLVLLMIKIRVNSEMYGINISEKEIQPSIKRLRGSDKIG